MIHSTERHRDRRGEGDQVAAPEVTDDDADRAEDHGRGDQHLGRATAQIDRSDLPFGREIARPRRTVRGSGARSTFDVAEHPPHDEQCVAVLQRGSDIRVGPGCPIGSVGP